MDRDLDVLRRQVARQVVHWMTAADALSNLEQTASAGAWSHLERYLGVAVRRSLSEAVEQLRREGDVLRARLRAASSAADLHSVQRAVVAFRDRYLQTETLVDFYGQAVNSRTNPELGTMLRACDLMARRSMEAVLAPLGVEVPQVLTYLERGLGASILKAGLRLWDGGTLSPAAAIKITFHNRLRPTALIHETGHQVAHLLAWNDELASTLELGLRDAPVDVRKTWASWSSEIAADCFAFVHTGFGSVSALSDVVGGAPSSVFRFLAGDPHPIAHLRVLLGVEMCVRFFGAGPWDDLGKTWRETYDVGEAAPGVRSLVADSLPLLPRITDLCLRMRQQAFKGRALSDLVDPARVKPEALRELERTVGRSLFASPPWILRECLRLLALYSLRFAMEPERGTEILRDQRAWMMQLGSDMLAAA
jgi:hypothetical protein